MKSKYSDDYKKKFVEAVLKINAEEGTALSKVAQKLGHTPITFRNWRKQLKNETTTVNFHSAKPKRKYNFKKKPASIVSTTEPRVAVFYCTPTQAAEIIRGL